MKQKLRVQAKKVPKTKLISFSSSKNRLNSNRFETISVVKKKKKQVF